MVYIEDLEQALPIFRALDSEIRLKILNMLMKNRRMNMNEIAKTLEISNAAITAHMKVLNEARLVGITSQAGKRGVQKVCYLNEDTILIKLMAEEYQQKSFDVELNVGYYSDYRISPTCGLATHDKIIGVPDQPSYFASPERTSVGLLWFAQGYIEYIIPNYVTADQTLKELQISFEISSEAPSYSGSWPSDIYLSLNDIALGFWTCPADVGEASGEKRPIWGPRANQSGMLKLLSVNNNGTFLDGMLLSDLTLEELCKGDADDFRFRLSNPKSAANVGGIALYGIGFGGFNQGIRAKMFYI